MENVINGRPTKAGLLVEYKVKEKTDKGIYLPADKQIFKGIVKVLAKGPNVKEIEVGDWILVAEGASPKLIELEGVIYGMLQEFEVDWIYTTPPKDVPMEDVPVIKHEDYLKRIAMEKRAKDMPKIEIVK
jgi:co-chaperonin GroES (HSP10)